MNFTANCAEHQAVPMMLADIVGQAADTVLLSPRYFYLYITSARYNNRYPIDQNMKFVKDGRKIRPYREFKKAGISRQWYDGMRLGELKDSSIVDIKNYYESCVNRGYFSPYWEEPGFFARIWNWIKGLFA